MAIKLHILCCTIRRVGDFLRETKEDGKQADVDRKEKTLPILLEPLIKNFLRGADPHGLPKGLFE